MRTVGITGAEGLLGWHLSCLLQFQDATVVKRACRADLESRERLLEFTQGCDAIIHCAGMNRGPDSDVASTNVRLTEQLVSAIKESGTKPHILFTNSTHRDRDTAYGDSKRVCSSRLTEWAQQSGAVFSDVVLPGIFGESGKPFYNSVVSTFCHQLAHGKHPELHQDTVVELMHAQDAAQVFAQLIHRPESGEFRPRGSALKTSELLAELRSFDASYRELVIPDLRESFKLSLFNTYRSYLFPSFYPGNLSLREDARGTLFEVEKNRNGGQAFVSTTVPGVTRGNHFHYRKIERFCVVQGQAKIQIRKLFDDLVHEFLVDGKAPQFIDMPTLHTHNITNTGSTPLLTLFWSGDIFDPTNPDTVGLPVKRERGMA
jgi:UDP-2-acetamido-2,6-beta-L-arabino-hexul-4-ose reductase